VHCTTRSFAINLDGETYSSIHCRRSRPSEILLLYYPPPPPSNWWCIESLVERLSARILVVEGLPKSSDLIATIRMILQGNRSLRVIVDDDDHGPRRVLTSCIVFIAARRNSKRRKKLMIKLTGHCVVHAAWASLQKVTKILDAPPQCNRCV
jgi:hypothetical protein